MNIYVNGLISEYTNYMERFSEAEEKLKEQEHEVNNPVKVNAILQESTTYDQHIALDNIMLDADNECRKVTPEFGKVILKTLEPNGIFWFEENNKFIAIDNMHSEMFMEEFSDFENCQKWIRTEKCVDANGYEHFD